MVCHSPLQWTTSCQTSPPWPDHLGWPHTAWLSFTELDMTVVLWSDWLIFCDYGVSVSALWCPLATPTVLLGFLLPWTWGISLQLLQQSTATAPYLGRGVSPHGLLSWTWTESSSSRPSCAHAATSPWMWGQLWWYYKLVFLEVIRIIWGHEVEPSWGGLVSVQGSEGGLAFSLCSLPCENKQYNLAECCHQNPTMMPPWSWTSTFQTVRNKFLLFISHFIYGMFVWAVQARTGSIGNIILTVNSNLK